MSSSNGPAKRKGRRAAAQSLPAKSHAPKSYAEIVRERTRARKEATDKNAISLEEFAAKLDGEFSCPQDGDELRKEAPRATSATLATTTTAKEEAPRDPIGMIDQAAERFASWAKIQAPLVRWGMLRFGAAVAEDPAVKEKFQVKADEAFSSMLFGFGDPAHRGEDQK